MILLLIKNKVYYLIKEHKVNLIYMIGFYYFLYCLDMRNFKIKNLILEQLMKKNWMQLIKYTLLGDN